MGPHIFITVLFSAGKTSVDLTILLMNFLPEIAKDIGKVHLYKKI